MTAFRSKPENCIVDVDLIAPLDDEWEYSMLVDVSEVLSDGVTPICAQVTHAGARKAAARLGWTILAPDDIQYLHELASRGECIELPAFTGTPTAEVTLEHRKRSDEANRAALKRHGHRPGVRWCNFGKVIVEDEDGPPPDGMWIMGWWVPELALYTPPKGQRGHRSGPGFIQQRPTIGRAPHGVDTQADDGTNCMVKRRRRLAAASDDGPPSFLSMAGGALQRLALWPARAIGGYVLRPRPLGARLVDWIRLEERRGIREIPGDKHHPAIQAYLAGGRRGGAPTAGFLGDRSGLQTLGAHPSDETEWCAASRAAGLAAVLVDGDLPPHGYRVSVREEVEDARALGTLHVEGDGYEPVPGDACILGRKGESPLNGGHGHICTVMARMADPFLTCGGNENNGWKYTWRVRKDVLGWIATSRQG